MATDSINKTNTQSCIEAIQRDILHGQFVPGEKLQTDKLKNIYHVGSSPIREALFQLSNTGLIEFTNNKGFSVKKISIEEVVDIYRTFTYIECLALELAIENGDNDWEGQILAKLHCLAHVENSKSTINYEEWVTHNDAFHQALINGCHSSHLLRIRNDLHQRFKWFGYLAFLDNSDSLKLNHKEHQLLAEAVLQRDKQLATIRMKDHIGDARSMMIPILQKRGLL